ncbi:bifunctional phosphopantothenoylcysteine decarboxylase/phosphopantothenate--cysteine ligase CoaBC [Leptolyngbya sp. PCC 6406]|uniref:bifunctional phosphopantothenoylcysteine decarboxylase/phosphopantothenate--cysteine ligase CoaBC n=1 Tax=Leptolyngbya sp. PCC 6406 TaxID=1173264 RepID=UPI00030A124A|nr:bifunctional phosphopantothenoylcysteine decarboxylase/phosphopantothenate--cysteine ligase CoaBC [Leptolyngbya sp. PCC 6406]
MLLGLGGGIAAYKLCEVASTLAQRDISVRPLFTAAAQRFITPLTLATLCRHRAYTDEDFWQASQGRPLHIELGEWADLLVIAPLTANTLGKLVYGMADNLLTNTVLASTCPVLVAPAMNTDMWEQVSVQRNWRQLGQDPRFHGLDPGAGRLACDRVGTGRMVEPAVLIAAIDALLMTGGRRDLAGKQILISTGSTREYWDPVRFIGNPASGKMGVALALAARFRGAQVTLVHGPMAAADLAPLNQVQLVPVASAAEMEAALINALPLADWVIMAAAIADVKPRHQATEKLPKAALPEALPLAPVPDIAARLSQLKTPQQKLIGFAAQTGDILAPAQAKLVHKGLDAIVANPIDQPQGGFGSEMNQAMILMPGRPPVPLPLVPKWQLAHQIYDVVLNHFIGTHLGPSPFG